MKKLIALLCCLTLASPLALAQDKGKGNEKKAAKAMEKSAKKEPSEAQKKQREKMKACNKQAADKKLKGDERKGFVSACLKG
jgi:hypothetical protein